MWRKVVGYVATAVIGIVVGFSFYADWNVGGAHERVKSEASTPSGGLKSW